MDTSITRRDFLGSTLLASGAALLPQPAPAQALDDFTGFGGLGDYANSNGNTRDVMLAGHQMRDGVFDQSTADVVDTGETYDCVIVGGGISGLAAAVTFLHEAGSRKSVLVLENHPIFGGEAKRNEFEVDGRRLMAHQGSNIYFVPYPHSVIGRFYESIGLRAPRLEYQRWDGPGKLGRTPYETADPASGQYGFWFASPNGAREGIWIRDPVKSQLRGAPLSDSDRQELLRWFSGSPGAADTPPKFAGDEISRYLDSITLEQHYMSRFGISQAASRKYLTAVEGGAYGLGPDALSAYTDYAFDLLHPLGDDSESAQMFPGGNAAIARLMVKTLNAAAIEGEHTIGGVHQGRVRFDRLDTPDRAARIRLSSTVVSVKHDGNPKSADSVSVIYFRAGQLQRVSARSVVVAGGSWTAKHIVKDLPPEHAAAYAQFHRSPCLMANVAVRNWRFLQKLGITGCRWFDGFGSDLNVYRHATLPEVAPTLSPDSPIVLTLKVLFQSPGLPTRDQGVRGRAEMLGTPFREYERRIREQFTHLFSGAGFNPRRDIAAIILNRWGHAYLSPQPGFFFGTNGKPAPRDVLRGAPFGRIAFANTDLAGAMDHRSSILEAQRAVNQLLDQVLTA
ncbi:MAG: NAD(P)-binding protein [Proteobacteria bacterium]|nr:NAD(P)-binding protein [Pseudomonadota bacterium]